MIVFSYVCAQFKAYLHWECSIINIRLTINNSNWLLFIQGVSRFVASDLPLVTLPVPSIDPVISHRAIFAIEL